MNKKYKMIFGLLVVSIVLPILLNDVHSVSAAYYGSVDFTGRVTIKTSEDAISGVTVKLLEDGVVKQTDTTDLNGNYSFTWTIVRFKLYTMETEEPGYNVQSTGLFFTGSDKNQDFELDGRVALLLWASDATNITVMEEHGNYLIDNEGFSDVLYRENQSAWKACINEVDQIETIDSLVFIYMVAHGSATGSNDPDNGGDSIFYQNTLTYQSDGLMSTNFSDKLRCLESQNVIVLVDSCSSGDFVFEYGKDSREEENVFVMATTEFEWDERYNAAMWFGDNFEYHDTSLPRNGSYGGAFSHYFFDYLDSGYDENDAFAYANSSTYAYAYAYFEDQYGNNLTQICQLRDNLGTTWFD